MSEYLIPEKCDICGDDIDIRGTWTKGHNAQPVADGRCCSVCNDTVVIPKRIERMLELAEKRREKGR
jgi:hypothetical protein